MESPQLLYIDFLVEKMFWMNLSHTNKLSFFFDFLLIFSFFYSTHGQFIIFFQLYSLF